jgi:hypothetical protein
LLSPPYDYHVIVIDPPRPMNKIERRDVRRIRSASIIRLRSAPGDSKKTEEASP